MKTLIGIDPGVKTGFAVKSGPKLQLVTSYTAVEAEDYILKRTLKDEIKVYIEDARKRRWYSRNEKDVQGKRQGAGSIKRDCQRWEEFCEYHKIDYELVAPKNNSTKLKSYQFIAYTGYQSRTNEHGRDAAMLIYGR